jgi:FkbM family methyltransferase
LTSTVEVDRHGKLLDELRGLLDEAPSAARQREGRLVGELGARQSTPIVLFGAGNLGRRTLALLRTHGHDVAAFLDNDRRLWGSSVDGVPVLSPDDGSGRFAADGLALVTIWRAEGGHDFSETRDGLVARGWGWVESFISLFWGYADDALPYITIDLPTNVLEAKYEIEATAMLWSDERSLREYVDQVRWRLTADFAALSPAEPNQYFAEGLVHVGPSEVFADCGAFTGDTLLDVARRVGSWRAYHAFEPDPATFSALGEVVAALPRALAALVHLHQAAISDRRGTARFSATGLGSAKLAAEGGYEVQCVSLDDVLESSPPSFVKMDIEGAEAAALAGSRRVIAEGRPLLAVAAYHNQADLWELPRLADEIGHGYCLFLRPHAAEGFDAVMYGIPRERINGAAARKA